jgi:hypothetical protein
MTNETNPLHEIMNRMGRVIGALEAVASSTRLTAEVWPMHSGRAHAVARVIVAMREEALSADLRSRLADYSLRLVPIIERLGCLKMHSPVLEALEVFGGRLSDGARAWVLSATRPPEHQREVELQNEITLGAERGRIEREIAALEHAEAEQNKRAQRLEALLAERAALVGSAT